MFSPHPEVIIEQVGVDGGLQVEGGRDKTLSSDLVLQGWQLSDAAFWGT